MGTKLVKPKRSRQRVRMAKPSQGRKISLTLHLTMEEEARLQRLIAAQNIRPDRAVAARTYMLRGIAEAEKQIMLRGLGGEGGV